MCVVLKILFFHFLNLNCIKLTSYYIILFYGTKNIMSLIKISKYDISNQNIQSLFFQSLHFL